MSDTGNRLSQRLSVVWFTDLVGYSSLSARDHDRALALVRRFQELVGRTVTREHGRVVKFVGDAALIESPSAEAAVQAAIALHAGMGEGLRTGIHLGDVHVSSDGDLYGDGVNGAQRIQSEAEPGQILVSEDVWRRLRNRPVFQFESVGERQLKNVEPMELFRLVSTATRAERASGPVGSLAPKTPDPTEQRGVRRSIAVLPFTNMSPQADNEYFSDGVTEEILALLTRIEGLKVISRTSVMQYKGTLKPMRQVGEELGVTTILEGSVRHAGSRVRITAQLIDAATDEHLWAERYDRDLEDIFAIQSDVAERIVEALRLRLTTRERTRLTEKPTESVEAYQWYLKGRHFLARRTEAALRQASDHFRKAVTADPQFAQAWVGLADALALLRQYATSVGGEPMAEARAAAEKALSLDARLGEAYASLGFIAMSEWKWEEADRHFRRALELSPAYVQGSHWYALLLLRTGRPEEAITTLRRAMELDPLSLPVQMAMGVFSHVAGRDDEALEIFSKAIELDPTYAIAYQNIGEVHMQAGRFAEALDAMTMHSRLNPDRLPPSLVDEVRAAYETGGERGFWEAMLEGRASRIADLGPSAYVDMAAACGQLARLDEAFAHLERLLALRHPHGALMATDPCLSPLHSDPRFSDLKRRIGLA